MTNLSQGLSGDKHQKFVLGGYMMIKILLQIFDNNLFNFVVVESELNYIYIFKKWNSKKLYIKTKS